MTGAEIELMKQLGEIPVQHFTITGAEDWPMFLAMIKFVGIVFCAAWGSVVGLVIYVFNDLKNTIQSDKVENGNSCTDCKKAIWEHISGPVWSAIESCCPRLSEAEKDILRNEIKKKTGECGA